MKNTLLRTFCLAALFLLSGSLQPLQAQQKDTLHIYYQGLQTNILDSNDAKITKWVKGLNGRKVELQIYGYYEDSQYKKFMAERVENLFMVVNRKARDQINVTFMGPVKGKKTQRSTADIVYSSANAPVAAPAAVTTTNKETPPAAAEVKEPKKVKEPKEEKAKEPKEEKKKKEKAVAKEEKKEVKEEKPAETPAVSESTQEEDSPFVEKKPVTIGKNEYFIDSVYVNGKLEVRKSKVKKKK